MHGRSLHPHTFIPPHPHTLHPQPLTPSLLPHPSHLLQIPCRYFMHRNSLITRVSPIRLCVTTSSHLLVECSHSMLPSEEHSYWQPSVYTQVSTGPIPRPPTRSENDIRYVSFHPCRYRAHIRDPLLGHGQKCPGLPHTGRAHSPAQQVGGATIDKAGVVGYCAC